MENNERDRTPLEYEYIMEGITTRMQTALEKLSSSLRLVCIVMLLSLLAVCASFIINNVIMINHINGIRSEVGVHETVPELGPDT